MKHRKGKGQIQLIFKITDKVFDDDPPKFKIRHYLHSSCIFFRYGDTQQSIPAATSPSQDPGSLLMDGKFPGAGALRLSHTLRPGGDESSGQMPRPKHHHTCGLMWNVQMFSNTSRANLFNYTFYRFWFAISKPLTKNRHFNIIEKAASLFSGWRCNKYDNKLVRSFPEKFHLTHIRTHKPVHDLLGLWENQTRKQLSPVTCRRCGYVHTVPDNTHTKRNEEQDTDVTFGSMQFAERFSFCDYRPPKSSANPWNCAHKWPATLPYSRVRRFHEAKEKLDAVSAFASK